MDEEEDKKQKQIITDDPPPPPPPPPSRIQSPHWLSPTFTYDVDGFLYHPGLSAAGIFSSSGTFRFLRPYPKLNLPAPSFFNIPTPFTVLSSSSGLLLVRSSSTYHVLNPFVHSPASHRQIPPPRRTHPPNTPAVLTVLDSVFHIICAVEEQTCYTRHTRYTFSIFSSNINNWSRTKQTTIFLDRRRVLPNTGVSNGHGMAFWLTNVPPIVIKATVKEGVVYAKKIDVPQNRIDPWASLQLGRLSESTIGLIAASRVNIVLLRLEIDGSWQSHGFLNVIRNENEAGDNPLALPVVCGGWQKLPEVMRFERDAMMWINGRMVVWEIDSDLEHRSKRIEWLHEMPAWTRRPESVEDAVPYVYTDLTGQSENKSTYKYHPGLSTAGFFSSAPSTDPAFHLLRPYPPLDIPAPSFFDIPGPFTILSSSGGLILIRSLPNSTYHVLNPFLHSPASHRSIPLPDRPHTPTTPAVLAVDTRYDDESAYHIICAVEEEAISVLDRCYTFDFFSSNTGEWTSTDLNDAVHVGTCRIIASTGVSNGCAMAFWLTDEPQAVVKATAGDLIDIPFGMLKPWATLQLGRLSESFIGIVAASRTDVFLLRIELDNSVEVHGFLKVKRNENEAGDDPGVMSVVCREEPEVMRFEWDVPLWVNGRMVVWQINGDARLQTMPELTRRPVSIRDIVPYVHTNKAAGDFTVAVFEEEGV